MRTVGVLVSRRIFQDCLLERSPYESFSLYERFGKKEGFKPIFFTLDHIRFSDGLVRAYQYVKYGKYIRKAFPLPPIIHNRVKPSGTQPIYEQLLECENTILFNKQTRLDKWEVYDILHQEPILRLFLPETHLLTPQIFRQMIRRYTSLYIKPRDKSLGMGVRRIEVCSNEIIVTCSKGVSEVVDFDQLDEWLEKVTEEEALLVQQGISLIKKGDQPIDFRVAVQKGSDGEWQVSGMVARVGPPNGIATNMAVGGRARQITALFEELQIEESAERLEEVTRSVIWAAQKLGSHFEGLADLGFDVAIDVDGRIWMIEVNGRDLRITFRDAKDWDAWKNTFAKPMEYAGYLLKRIPPPPTQVAIVTPGVLPVGKSGSGSIEICAAEISKAMCKNNKVYVLGNDIQLPSDIETVDVDTEDRKQYLVESVKRLQQIKPQIIQVENRPLWIHELNKGNIRAKKILYLHSETFLRPPYANPQKIGYSLSLYDAIVTNSQFMLKRLSYLFPTITHKMHVVPLGVDLTQFASIHSEAVRQQRIQNRKRYYLTGRPVLLHVGRLLPKKGAHHLIEAVDRLRKDFPKLVLMVIGSSYYGKNTETPYVKELHEKTKSWGDSIRWWPYTSHYHLPFLYQMADILVTPSICYEAFGLVNVEGMACGLPILTTRMGGISEVVEDGVNGKLLATHNLTEQLRDTLHDWLSQPECLKEMGRASRARAEALYSWNRVADELTFLYQQLK